MKKSANQLVAYVENTGGGFWKQIGLWGQATAIVLEGTFVPDMRTISEGLDGFIATGAKQHIPIMMLSVAEAHYNEEAYDDALKILDQSNALIQETAQHFYEPEMWRWRGLVLYARGETEAAIASLEKAISVADSQESVSWRDRAQETLNEIVKQS